MKRTSVLILGFAIASFLFFILLILFRFPSALSPLMSWQDVLDLLTPLVLIPMYWKLFEVAGHGKQTSWEKLAFILFAGAWVLGHGMHLSANSINNLAEARALGQGSDLANNVVYQLIHFYDEILSHYTWHAGIIGLTALLMTRAWRDQNNLITNWGVSGVAGVIYGITYFLVILEGNTLTIGLPFAAIASIILLIWGRQRISRQPVLAFFFMSFALATLLFIGWRLYFGGFIPPSELGII